MKTIYASSGPHALIRNNRIPAIGTITQFSQNYDLSGHTQQITRVIFNFDNNSIEDEFFFIEGKLCFSSINIIRRKFMREFYRVLLEEHPNIEMRAFIFAVKDFYINFELGFYS